jgi:hypothetical protein
MPNVMTQNPQSITGGMAAGINNIRGGSWLLLDGTAGRPRINAEKW